MGLLLGNLSAAQRVEQVRGGLHGAAWGYCWVIT